MERLEEHFEICPYCDTLTLVEGIEEGERVCCTKCGSTLTFIIKNPIKIPFIYACVSVFLFVCSELLPFLGITKMGITANMTLMETATSMFVDNYEFLAVFIYCNMQLFPILCLFCIIFVYGCILLKKSDNLMAKKLIKLFFHLKEWSMVEVFMIAILVSMVKLVSMVELQIGDGFITFCLFLFFYVKTVSSVDKNYIWSKLTKLNNKHAIFNDLKKHIGQYAGENNLILCTNCNSINHISDKRCYLCKSKIDVRKKNSIQKCLALAIAATIMLITANVFQIIITSSIGKKSVQTIFEGIIFMWDTGAYHIALIIFIASIMVPIFKIAVLLALCYSVTKQKNAKLKIKTKLYGITEFIGKWSMVDVFVVAVLSALIKMGKVLSIYPGTASLSFCATVILTMLAANSFDPRTLWSDVK